MTRLVVIGGGIAGLAAAHRLHALHPRAEVLLLEAGSRVGGKLRRVEVAGAWVDVGAEAMLARRPEGLAAIGVVGLDASLVHPLTTGALLRNRGRNRPLPARTLMGLPTDLDTLREADVLSAETIARIAAEPAGGPYPPLAEDVSVGDLIADRFGAEVVDRLVDPLLGGVYAGQARDISLRAAVPMLARRLMSEGGSLLAAAQANVSAGARDEPGPPVFASLAGGLARLPETLAAAGGFEVRLDSTVRGMARTAGGFRLELGPVPAAAELAADAVVVATPAGKAAGLLAELAPAASAELAGIETASMAIVTLAFRLPMRHRLPAGSGLLIPEVEGLACKAMTFSSQKWPGVGAESGVLLMRASLGRAGSTEVLQRPDEELVGVVRRELAELTGVLDVPVDSHVQRWGGALPQYAVGHVDRVDRIRSAVAAVPGLAVCGASYDGVGIPACIATGHSAADQVSAALGHAAQ
ncbi:MAG TPA: protoporphyrinogen oxidase [Jatrophihabitans sp.]|nr:protoporphyrinogen oxidase [Jatrophihabitans sp.]